MVFMKLIKNPKIHRNQTEKVLIKWQESRKKKLNRLLFRQPNMVLIKLPKMVLINNPKSSSNRNLIDFFWMTLSIKRLQED